MEESRSVTPWVNRFYFESPRASSFLGLRLVKARHKNLFPLFSGVKPGPMVGSGRYAESIPVKSPIMMHKTYSVTHCFMTTPKPWPRTNGTTFPLHTTVVEVRKTFPLMQTQRRIYFKYLTPKRHYRMYKGSYYRVHDIACELISSIFKEEMEDIDQCL